MACDAERERLVDGIEHASAILVGDLVGLEPRDRRRGILLERGDGLELHQLALALLGLRERILGPHALAGRDVALVDDAAERFDADGTEGDRTRERDRDDPAVLRELLAHQRPRRIGVCADELAGVVAAEILGERGRRRVSIVGVARHRLRDDRAELAGDRGDRGGERPRRSGEHAIERGLGRRVGVGRRAGEQLVEDRADRVDIRALVDELAARLLGGHVRRRADDLAGDRRARARSRRRDVFARVRLGQIALAIAREAPVDHDGLAERADHDVRGLEIAVDHALAVRVTDGVGDRDHVWQEREPLAQRGALGDLLLEGRSLDELHHVVRIAVRPASRLVHGDDARVLEPRRDQRLAHEPRLARFVAPEQLLHRDGATETLVHRAHDATETTARVLRDLLVALGIIDHRVRGHLWWVGSGRGRGS